MSKLRRTFFILGRALPVIVLVVHFALTLVYSMPVNPVKLEYQKVLNKTIGTYFQQNWRLFAPNPLTDTQSVLVRCLNESDGRRAISSATATSVELPSDGWNDVTGILWRRFQQSRFSAYDRLARPFSNAAREFVSGGTVASEWAESCRKGNQESCEVAEKFAEISRLGAQQLLRRMGSAYCRESHSGQVWGGVRSAANAGHLAGPVVEAVRQGFSDQV